MKSIRLLAVFSVALLVFLGARFFLGDSLYAQETAAGDKLAPAWKLPDLDGNLVASDSFRGKVVVVDFWATWCPPCIAEIPGYIEMQKKYGGQGLVIVGISLDQKTPEQVKQFVTAKGMNYTVVMADDEVSEAFGGIDAIPTTFLINREGRIVHRKKGAMAHKEYEQLVQQALK